MSEAPALPARRAARVVAAAGQFPQLADLRRGDPRLGQASEAQQVDEVGSVALVPLAARGTTEADETTADVDESRMEDRRPSVCWTSVATVNRSQRSDLTDG